jgi:hypothetical protein
LNEDDRAVFSDKAYADNHTKSAVREAGVLRVIMWLFGYTKVRRKGLAKNAAEVFPLIELTALLYLARR